MVKLWLLLGFNHQKWWNYGYYYCDLTIKNGEIMVIIVMLVIIVI